MNLIAQANTLFLLHTKDTAAQTTAQLRTQKATLRLDHYCSGALGSINAFIGMGGLNKLGSLLCV